VLADLLPSLTSLRTLTIYLWDSDSAFWALLPDTFGALTHTSLFPRGLNHLTTIYMEGNGTGESLLDAKLAVRLMFLPNLQRLHLLRITDLGHDWSDAEKDRLSSLRGTSMVSALRFIEDCQMTFSNVMDFLKLSKTLTELEFPMHPDTSLSTLKQHLWLHRETLQTLVLTNGLSEFLPTTDVLGDLRGFPVLRCLELDIHSLLAMGGWSVSLANIVPPMLEMLHLILVTDNGLPMDPEAACSQVLDMVRKSSHLTDMTLFGEIGIDWDRIQDECDERGIELNVEVW
jgi:hypothetical protein